jgi:hypothetical protein
MHDSLAEAARWVSAAAAASPDEDVPELGEWAADAIPGPAPSNKVEAVSPRTAAALATGLFRYGPHAAVAVWLIAVAWMAGSHFVGPARTVVQQESMQSVEMGQAAQKMAEEPHTQNPDDEAMRAAESLSAKDAIGLGNTKPGLDAAKTEISAQSLRGGSSTCGPNRRRSLPKQPSGSIALHSRSRRSSLPLPSRTARPSTGFALIPRR